MERGGEQTTEKDAGDVSAVRVTAFVLVVTRLAAVRVFRSSGPPALVLDARDFVCRVLVHGPDPAMVRRLVLGDGFPAHPT